MALETRGAAGCDEEASDEADDAVDFFRLRLFLPSPLPMARAIGRRRLGHQVHLKSPDQMKGATVKVAPLHASCGVSGVD